MLPNQNSLLWKILLGIVVLFFLFLLIFNDNVVDFIFSYLLLYKYTILFLVVFLGGLIIPLPVNVILMAVGALSVQGFMDFNTSLILATVANVIGNLIAHNFFRKYGHSILRDQYIAKYPFFTKLEEYFLSYTNITIFISRIIGLFGTPTNFLAGYFKISTLRFTVFDILGNFVYALIFLEMGRFVGERWLRVSEIMSSVISVISLAVLISIGLLLYFRTRKVRTSIPTTPQQYS